MVNSRAGSDVVTRTASGRFDAVAPRVLHQLGGRIKTHRLAVEQRGAERRRPVALQP